MIILLSLLISYLFGSINPSYFLGKWLKGIDVREKGDKNAGTINVGHVLGKSPAIFVAIFDLTKGLLAMYIAFLIGAPLLVIYLAGIFSIIGHIFPFYLKFKGGQGAATAAGLLVYSITLLFINGQMPLIILALLAGYTAIIAFIVHKSDLIAFFTLPFILFWVLFYTYKNFDLTILFITLIILFLFALNVFNYVRGDWRFNIKPKIKKEFSRWRVILRPAAVVFPILYFFIDKRMVLIFVGIIALISIIIDISRLSSHKLNEIFYKSTVEIFKEKEHKKISSMTIFLVASFLTFLLFEKDIAILAITFLIFGDFTAKFFGLQFGRINIFRRTLEGSLSYFLICFLFGLLLSNFLNLQLLLIFLGAFSAAIAELVPLGVDDNFTVPIISGAVMAVVRFFMLV